MTPELIEACELLDRAYGNNARDTHRAIARIRQIYRSADLYSLIERYYDTRGLTWPTTNEALDWLLTELAEAKELLLARNGEWVRNNPDQHPGFDNALLEEELGDIVMMALVAGRVEGLDPIGALVTKIEEKMNGAES